MKLIPILLISIIFAFSNAGMVEHMLLKQFSDVPDHFPSNFIFFAREKEFGIVFATLVNGDKNQLSLVPVQKMSYAREAYFDFADNKIYFNSIDEDCWEVLDYDLGVDNLTQFIDDAWQQKTAVVDEPMTKIYNVDPGKNYVKFNLTYFEDDLDTIKHSDWTEFGGMEAEMLSTIIDHKFEYDIFLPGPCLKPKDFWNTKKYSNLLY